MNTDASAGASTPATATCPHCGIVVRNVTAAPGATIPCLNCGKRFAHNPDTDGGTGIPACPSQLADKNVCPTAPSPRLPPSPGYWLLRIPAILACAVAAVATPLIVYDFISRQRHHWLGIRDFVELSYLALIPLGAVFLYLLTRSFARSDSAAIRAAWSAGLLTKPLFPPLGSSMPLVAPVAIIGGVLPVGMMCTSDGDSESAIVGALLGAAIFYVGFMQEDLRCFLWRQKALAWRCYRAAGGKKWPTRFPLCGWLLAAASLFVAAAMALFFAEACERSASWYGRSVWNDLVVYASIGAGSLAVAWSSYLLGRGWDSAVGAWECAARQANAGRADETPPAPTMRPRWPVAVAALFIACRSSLSFTPLGTRPIAAIPCT